MSASRLLRGSVGAVAATIAVLLGYAVLQPPPRHAGLGPHVARAMDPTGVAHPVTAVLLDFRGYDTWLEVGVLLAAALGILSMRRAGDLRDRVPAGPPGPMLSWLARLAVPWMLLVSGYLLWLGTHAPGGAFQAGAVAGAAGVLLLFAGYRSVEVLPTLALRSLLVAGFAAFLLVGAVLALAGRPFLDYPPAAAGVLILAVETAVTVSIAVTLVVLLAGGRPGPAEADARRRGPGAGAP